MFAQARKSTKLAILILATFVSACGNGLERECQSKLVQASKAWQEFTISSSTQKEVDDVRRNISEKIKGCEESPATFDIPLMGDWSFDHMFAITGNIQVLRERYDQSLLTVELYMEDREPLLHWTAAWGGDEVLSFLIDIGFDVHGGEEKEMEPPIFYAAQNVLDDPHLVVRMVSEGVDPSVTGMQGRTILHAAVNSERKHIAEFLVIELGKCPKHEDTNGADAMHIAEERELERLLEVMHEYAPDNC